MIRVRTDPRALAVTAALLCVLGATSACGDGGDASTGADGDPVVIDVSFDGDSVTPSGDRVEVGVGQPVELEVTADAPGEIHVHSDPEQEVEYDAGSQVVTLDPIERPGIVEVESHSLDKVIVQLEVK